MFKLACLSELLFVSFLVITHVCFQARKNELAVEDMDGGTFTISNGGVFGSMFGTPIINPPQSAILGMHGIFDRPVAVGGKVCFLVHCLGQIKQHSQQQEGDIIRFLSFRWRSVP